MLPVAVILFVGYLAQIEAGCPIKCTCTDNTVACISKSLKYVPYFESLTNNPIIIDLSGNSIQMVDIDDFSFDKSDQVKEIYLNSSELTSIEEQAFEELDNLQELYMADNFLSSLPEDFITNNENMILLDVSSNYFVDLPKIRSDSLEVLAAANCEIEHVSEDALTDLPNLKVLLMQQNNLKYVDAMVFHNMHSFYFIKMAHNPWQCNCKTVKLFNYLNKQNFIDITEPVQCQTEDKVFIDIYDNHGVTSAFKEQCTNGDLVNNAQLLSIQDVLKNIKESDDQMQEIESESEDAAADFNDTKKTFQGIDVFYSCIILLAVLFSLAVGAVFGSIFTYRYMIVHLRQTQSTNQLLSKSNENLDC